MRDIRPAVRSRVRDLYMRGDRAGAQAVIASEQARPRSVRFVEPPSGVKVCEPPFRSGCFHCGDRHS